MRASVAGRHLCVWEPELPLYVEEYVCLAPRDRVRVGRQDLGVVEVVPLAVLGDERGVVTGAGAGKGDTRLGLSF